MDFPLGSRLRRVRRAKDLTQQELGKLAGVNYTTISRIESGEAKQIYVETFRALAKALGVSADYLLGLSNDPGPIFSEDEESELEPAAVALASV
jgi:transcriptional regulator with XRE-family HTH domain